MSKDLTIFLHLPAYREPELIPTIEDALKQAKYPNRLHFGICRQYEPEDGFDDLTPYKDNPNFHIHEMLAKDAQGLPYARAIINEKLLSTYIVITTGTGIPASRLEVFALNSLQNPIMLIPC